MKSAPNQDQSFLRQIYVVSILFSTIWEVVVRFVDGLGLVDDGWRHFQQCFSYVVAVSFIGWGNLSALRKPPTFRE
jgi:hypothetical protein